MMSHTGASSGCILPREALQPVSVSTDLEFAKQADAFMEGVMQRLSEFDPDELDCDLAMGVLTMEFEDGSKCIMNRQTAAHQIWLAVGVSAWHFDFDPKSGRWLDTKGGRRLEDVLAESLSARLRRPIRL
jgi:CyaY protein